MINKRLALAGVAAIGLAAAILGRAGPGVPDDPDLACGLGLPPDAPGFAEAQAREREQVRKTGYQRVCAANLERFEMTFKGGATIPGDLAFEPLTLAGTPFGALASLGSVVEEVGDTKSRLYRGFRTAAGHTMTLFEHDMSADGTRSSRDPQDEPERINGLPARLVVLQAASGKAVSMLSWVEGRRSLEVWIDANVAGKPLREELFALAASLPKSNPACPNEAPAQALRRDAHGYPVTDLPDSFSEAGTPAMLSSQRPCK